MVTTRDPALAQRIDCLRNHGASLSEEQRHEGPRPYLLPEFNLLGFNYRMTDLQGAVGLVQLGKLDAFIEERERWARFYRSRLSGLPWLVLPEAPEGWQHGWQSFVCRVIEERAPLSRNRIMEVLQDKWAISTRPGTHAVHLLGLYRQRFGLAPEHCPVARDCDRTTLAIPLHNRMSSDDYGRVVRALSELGA